MADLGVINTLVVDEVKTRLVPSLLFGVVNALIFLDNTGVFSGDVLNDSTPVQGVSVHLFHKPSLQLMATETTGVAGEFQFTNLVRVPEAFFVIAFDPAGGEEFNALIYDKVTPV